MSSTKKNINILHTKLGNPSEVISHATVKAMGIQLLGLFQACKDCTLGKARNGCVSKKAGVCSIVMGERLFYDISSPSFSTFGGMKHWLLVIEDSADYVWSYFLKEKLELKNLMMGLMKNFKT